MNYILGFVILISELYGLYLSWQEGLLWFLFAVIFPPYAIVLGFFTMIGVF